MGVASAPPRMTRPAAAAAAAAAVALPDEDDMDGIPLPPLPAAMDKDGPSALIDTRPPKVPTPKTETEMEVMLNKHGHPGRGDNGMMMISQQQQQQQHASHDVAANVYQGYEG